MNDEPQPGRHLDVLYFKLFDDCNAKCVMCSCWEAPRTRRDPAFYQERLSDLLSLHPASVRFTGGEPLLLRSLPDLIAQASKDGVRTSVITNGRLLAGRAAELSDAGCAEIVLSLDGAGLAHDTIRAAPDLFDRCIAGIESMNDCRLPYGMNTVVQRDGIDTLPELADLLLGASNPPTWWQFMPIRDYPDLTPSSQQLSRFRSFFPRLRSQAAATGVTLIADAAAQPDGTPAACTVPEFTAYVAADTGLMFGCNMLCYRDSSIGPTIGDSAVRSWTGASAERLRDRCRDGANAGCADCDPASRAMNHHLRDLATAYRRSRTSDLNGVQN